MKTKKIKCPNCGSGYGYVKFSTNEWMCRQCNSKTLISKIKKGDKE